MSHILLVDDDRDQLDLRRLILENSGLEVSTAASAADAVACIADQLPDKVLLDLSLPRVEDGLALIRRLRDDWPAVDIFVLSGRVEQFAGMPEAGMVAGIFRKPASYDDIVPKLAGARAKAAD